MQPRILHIRNIDRTAINALNPKGISNFGGATVAYMPTENGLVVSVSRCHPGDNFRKEYGRKTALHRFNNGVTETIICHEVETIQGCVRRWYDEVYRLGWKDGTS
jgi:hypothetical protein